MDVGVALWTMQSTAAHPVNLPTAYARLEENARLAEDLGFHSLWLAEHRFWYDGWCPSPLVAAAAAAGATTRLRVGTAMLLLPQRDAGAVARDAATLNLLSRGRLDLGVALGYRDEEFDGLGLARADRGRLMEAGLESLHRTWQVSPASAEAQTPHPPVWMGGMAGPALERGARWGCNFLLPPTLATNEVAIAIDRIRRVAKEVGQPMGRVGIVKDTWVDTDSERARTEFLPALTDAYREYGSWWVFKGRFTGHERPDLVDRQVERSVATALVGDPAEITAGLQELADAGVDTVALHLNRAATRATLEQAMALVGAEVLPHVAGEDEGPPLTADRC